MHALKTIPLFAAVVLGQIGAVIPGLGSVALDPTNGICGNVMGIAGCVGPNGVVAPGLAPPTTTPGARVSGAIGVGGATARVSGTIAGAGGTARVSGTIAGAGGTARVSGTLTRGSFTPIVSGTISGNRATVVVLSTDSTGGVHSVTRATTATNGPAQATDNAAPGLRQDGVAHFAAGIAMGGLLLAGL